jgi:ribosome-associated translation inhibitor RaiA
VYNAGLTKEEIVLLATLGIRNPTTGAIVPIKAVAGVCGRLLQKIREQTIEAAHENKDSIELSLNAKKEYAYKIKVCMDAWTEARGQGKMKITATINLDHYENIKVESSEADMKTCLDEVKDALTVIGTPHTQAYVSRVLSTYEARITALQDIRDDQLGRME